MKSASSIAQRCAAEDEYFFILVTPIHVLVNPLVREENTMHVQGFKVKNFCEGKTG